MSSNFFFGEKLEVFLGWLVFLLQNMDNSSFSHRNENMKDKITTHLCIFMTWVQFYSEMESDHSQNLTYTNVTHRVTNGLFPHPAAYYKHTVNATWCSINLLFIFPITAAYFASVGRTGGTHKRP